MKLVVKKDDDKNRKQLGGAGHRTDHFEAVKYTVNEVVEGKCCHWKHFYRGTVKKVNADGTYEVHFDDGEVRHKFRPLHMRKVKFSNSKRPAKENRKSKYEVGQTVEGKCCGWKKFYKGVIRKDNGDDTYEIHFDDGETRKKFKSAFMRAYSTNTKKVSHNRSGKGDKKAKSQHSVDTVFSIDDSTKKLIKETVSLIQDGIITEAQGEELLLGTFTLNIYHPQYSYKVSLYKTR